MQNKIAGEDSSSVTVTNGAVVDILDMKLKDKDTMQIVLRVIWLYLHLNLEIKIS